MQILFYVLASGASLAAALLVVWWLEMRRQYMAQAAAVQGLQADTHARQWAHYDLEARVTRALDAYERRDHALSESVSLLNHVLRELEQSWQGAGAQSTTSLPVYQADLVSTEGDPAGVVSRLQRWEARLARHGDSLSAELARQADAARSLSSTGSVTLSSTHMPSPQEPATAGMMVAIDELRQLVVDRTTSAPVAPLPAVDPPQESPELAETRAALARTSERVAELSQALAETASLAEVEAGLEDVLLDAGLEAPTWSDDDRARQADRMAAIRLIAQEWSSLRATSIGLQEHAQRVAGALSERERELAELHSVVERDSSEGSEARAEYTRIVEDRLASCREELEELVDGLGVLASACAAPVEDSSSQGLLQAVARALGLESSELGACEAASDSSTDHQRRAGDAGRGTAA